ncbi:MAG: glutamate synthase [Acidobacteria bacterium 13_1_40CM_3_56_11]|nr:MAG: glutamate synthase [Acidobacteria bacterium 13_1_40CM_3_56_11]
MGNPKGFLEIGRVGFERRPVEERIQDWNEVYKEFPEDKLKAQASRCMDCGVPFCHQGCPLGNIIPDWNDLVYRGQWQEALLRLLATNNFPEFTGRLCPAPCEGSCVLGINADPVTIKNIEVTIIDRAFKEGIIRPRRPVRRTGKAVAIVGSGPAGLAAAAQLNQAGHWVTVYERDDRIGGLLRYGIPEFKMEKKILDRRLNIMLEEGVMFRTNANVGVNVSVEELRREFDAILLAGGATAPRDLQVPGRELKGVYFAMEFLPLQNKRCEGDNIPDADFISAKDQRVVIIGGGDTGADCLGTVHRQGCRSVVQFEILPKPPGERAADNPWPNWPNIFRTSSAHEEGGGREYCVLTTKLTGRNGHVEQLHVIRVEFEGRNMREIPGTEFTIDADLVLLAMGFLGPEKKGMLDQLGVVINERGNVATNAEKMTNIPGVFAAGDMSRGQSLIVWAIREGRQAARFIDKYLMGFTDLL